MSVLLHVKTGCFAFSDVRSKLTSLYNFEIETASIL